MTQTATAKAHERGRTDRRENGAVPLYQPRSPLRDSLRGQNHHLEPSVDRNGGLAPADATKRTSAGLRPDAEAGRPRGELI